MIGIYWIFFIAITTVCVQAGKEDLDALEKKMEMFERQLKSCNSRLKSQDKRLDNHDTRLGKLESEPSLCNTTMYSFSTRLHQDTDLNDGPVIFGTVNINIGGGYDEFTGVFHAPVSGLYLLSVYAQTADDGGDVYVRKNDEVVCRTHVTHGNSDADSMGLDTGTCTGIAELVPGDSVRVTGSTDYPARIAEGDSGFIGHLIQPYC